MMTGARDLLERLKVKQSQIGFVGIIARWPKILATQVTSPADVSSRNWRAVALRQQ